MDRRTDDDADAAAVPFRYHHLRHVERILCLSDLHTDHPQNLKWVEAHAGTLRRNDVVIVAGDISHRLSTFRATVRRLTDRGCRVVFVPGNHEAWRDNNNSNNNNDDDEDENNTITAAGSTTQTQSPPSSFAKLESIYAICREEGVLVDPVYVEGDGATTTTTTPVWILPLESWYDGTLSFNEELCQGFDKWPWVDFDRCVWPGFGPADLTSPNARIPQGLVEHFLRRNQRYVLDPWRRHLQQQEQQQQADDATTTATTTTTTTKSKDLLVITVSHFAPNQQCLPDWKDLSATTFQTDAWLDHGSGGMSAKFAKVAGTRLLDAQLRRNIRTIGENDDAGAPPPPPQPHCHRHIHVFGHSHRPKDFEYESIRYIHHPLGKPRERELHMIDPDVTFQCVWANGTEVLRGEDDPALLRYWEQYGGGTEMLHKRWDRVRSTATTAGRYQQR